MTETLDVLSKKEDRYRHELAVASKLQADLLPALCDTQQFCLRTVYSPFHEVSGDSYWYHWNPSNRTLYGYVIDVSGHGLSTALQTAAINVLFREAVEAGYSPAAILSAVNRRASGYLQESFAAAICFQLDFDSSKITYASAGISFFLTSSSQLPPVVKIPGLLIGILDEERYDEHTVAFSSGDCFYFLSDGLWEVLPEPENLSVGQFDRLLNLMNRICHGSKAENLPGRYRGLVPWDDATALCIKIK